MNVFQKEYIGLLRAAFTDEAVTLSPEFDWEIAVKVAKKHNIAPILFYGAVACGVPQESEPMQELYQLTLQSTMVSIQQVYEIEQITATFEKDGIAYMPMKGAILKNLYPKAEMRTMGDADILIKLEQYAQIQSIMTQLGFDFQYESDHEFVWQKPSLFLELHKSVMTSYNKDFYAYFGNGWKRALPIDGCHRYEMSPEDFYIYIFVHFTKHYRISGIGIKHLLDLWVYIHAYTTLNWDYITSELAKMGLALFHQNVLDTLRAWFDGGEETDVTDLITTVIFKSGQYGTYEMALVNRALQHDQNSAMAMKVGKTWHSVFVPYQSMKKKYAVLEKAPILLPIMWIVRCFEILFFRSGEVKRYAKDMGQIDTKQLHDNKRALEAVGLSFRHEEQ